MKRRPTEGESAPSKQEEGKVIGQTPVAWTSFEKEGENVKAIAAIDWKHPIANSGFTLQMKNYGLGVVRIY
jgi:hypothetical protein